jgi:hypothetical protein
MTPDEALAVLTAYLRGVRLTAAYPLDEDGQPIRPDGEWTGERSPAGDTARIWARELLEAGDTNGYGACRLCGS